MSELHRATSGALIRELVNDAADEFREWMKYASSEAAAVNPRDPKAAAEFALADVLVNIEDHLGIRFAVTLATYGLGPEGEQTP